MKTIYFDDEIHYESVTLLIKKFEELKLVDDEKIYLYFSSNGGIIDDGKVLIDYINNSWFRNNLIMVASGVLFSEGLNVFLETKTKKRIFDNIMILFHIPTSFIDYREEQNSESTTQVQKKQLEKMKKEFLVFCKQCGLSKNEIEKLNKGEDLCYTESKLKDICKKLNLEVLENK